MTEQNRFSKTLLNLLILWIFLGAPLSIQASTLLQDYQQVSDQPQKTPLPFIVVTSEQENRLNTQIYSVVEQPLDRVAQAFTNLSNWCEFLPLHLNVKTCLYQQPDGQTDNQTGDQSLLTLYLGRKFYQPPEAAYQITYQYQVDNKDQTGFKVSLQAAEGPLDTENYQMIIEAEKLNNKTLVRVSMAYSSSMLSRVATETYLLTLGRGKIGFSLTGTDAAGEPVFSDGINAIIERNAMRYYLAMKAYIDTQSLPENQRFEARITAWFDLTEQFARQLHELERTEYLDAKHRERKNQLQLQKFMDTKIR